MKTLIESARKLQGFMESRQWPFCFIGGIALLAWGRPRLTVDIDISLYTGFGKEAPFIDALLEAFSPRISDAGDFALKNRVLLLKTNEGIGIDAVLSALAYEKEMIDGASDVEFLPGINLRVCRAEDLIVLKAFADRAQDWADVESVVESQGDKLDGNYIIERLIPLTEAKEAPKILERVKVLLSIQP